ncbi:MAG: kelch repeat-containing protein, partial [Bacteriovoracaceae bacterium]
PDNYNYNISHVNNTDVDLSGKNISDLRPLNQFTHFVSLNLSQNKIKSLNELSKLVNLTSLDLSENKISSPDPLSVLVGLQYLNLAGNEIIDTVSLESLGELTRLDLRNNSSDIKCPLEDDSICLTEDYSNTTSFVTIDRTLRIGRWGHQSIKLDDGRIFITGGFSTNSHEIDLKKSQASEFFNPTFNEFKKGKKMSFSRVYHSATKLRNGRVLLVGGFFSGNRIEIYDPKKNQFQVVATAPSLIARHEAIELKDGRVLITGGNSRFIDFEAPLFATARSYIFDPRDNSFNSIGSMNVPRFGHQMTMLNSGEVLITGGFDVTESLNSAEIFNPLTERFEAAPSRLKSHRGFHSALKMNNGNVVLLGGADKDAKAISSVEIFDHQTKSFQDQGDLLVEPRLRLNALKLNSGRIVVIGGGSQFISHYEDLRASSHCYKSGEILDLNKKLSTKLGDQMQDARCGATLNEIDSNHLLILGGRGAAPAYSASMFEFTKL